MIDYVQVREVEHKRVSFVPCGRSVLGLQLRVEPAEQCIHVLTAAINRSTAYYILRLQSDTSTTIIL